MNMIEKDKQYLIGVDMGSTGIKAAALCGGRIAASARRPMVYHENQNICEYDAELYYQTIADLIREITGHMPKDTVCAGIAAVCASGNTLLVKNGKPLTPVFSWRDHRGGSDLEAFFGHVTEEQIHQSVGWHKVPQFPLAQLCWLKRNTPELLTEADMICEGSCYINYRLCGHWYMDYSTATTFYLQDQRTLHWNPKTLEVLGIPEYKLPKLVPVGTQIGVLTEEAAKETGLPAGTPVIAGCYDGAAAARSVGLLEEHQLLISCGTSWVCLYPSKNRKQLLDLGVMIDPYLTEYDLWLGMTSLGESSVYVDQVLDQLLPKDENRPARFSSLSARSVPGAHGLLINPMRLEQSGDLSVYTAEDICRAVMEGIVYSVKRQLLTLPHNGSPLEIRQITMAGGPSNSQIWPQIVSDIMETPVQVMFSSAACAVGAAMIAGIGAGIFTDIRDAHSCIREEPRVYTPAASSAAIYRQGFLRFQNQFPGPDKNMH